MKLSENTLAVLKNFSEINESIVLKQGKEIQTISLSNHIMGNAKIPEEIPIEFGIYSLATFLSNVNLMGDDCNIDFDGDKLILSNSEGYSIEFCGAEPSLIHHPTKKISFNSSDVDFVLPNDKFQKMIRVAALNKLDNLAVSGSSEGLFIKVFDKSGATHNTGKLKIGDWDGQEFESVFSVSHLKILPLDYKVSVNFGGIAQLVSTDGVITYYVSLVGE